MITGCNLHIFQRDYFSVRWYYLLPAIRNTQSVSLGENAGLQTVINDVIFRIIMIFATSHVKVLGQQTQYLIIIVSLRDYVVKQIKQTST